MKPLVNNYVWKNFRVLGPRVDEIITGVFSAVWEHIHQFDSTKPFSGWISGIMRNECLVRLRTNAKAELYAGQNPLHEINWGLGVEGENNIEQWEENEYKNYAVEAVYKAVNRLPKMYKDCFSDMYIHQLTIVEISEKYGWNVNTTKTRMRDAIWRIKCYLYPNEDPTKFRVSRNSTRTLERRPDGTTAVVRHRKRKAKEYPKKRQPK
jgi:RNA polymerase sigma factor (sigma-70 family)